MPAPTPNKRPFGGKAKASGGSGGGGAGGGAGERKRGFRVGPAHAPKDAYLGKAKKIKQGLIENAKLKQRFAKELKKDGLSSTRLADRSAGPSSSAAVKGGKGKGKSRAEERAEQGPSDDDDDEPSAPAPAPAPAASTSRQPTNLADQPHAPHAPYRPNVRQPLAVHAHRSSAATSAPASTGSRHQGQEPEQPKRWAPAKGATGKARQPRMGAQMDGLLAKIRKGL